METVAQRVDRLENPLGQCYGNEWWCDGPTKILDIIQVWRV